MNERLTLFRGIAVARERATDVVASIHSAGIRGDEGWWHFGVEDVRDRISTLFHKEDLSTTDTRHPDLNSYKSICACGDELGASYYALIHNRHREVDEASYVVKFTAPLESVSVDGRDFLYTCFQLWDRHSADNYEMQGKALARLFGPAILKYFVKAASSQEQQLRIAMCELACQDQEIVLAHAKNLHVIRGRYGVVFRSAFFVRVPIEPSQIVDVRLAREQEFNPAAALDDFLKGRLCVLEAE